MTTTQQDTATASPFARRRAAFAAAMLELSPAHAACRDGMCACDGAAFHEGVRRAWAAVPADARPAIAPAAAPAIGDHVRAVDADGEVSGGGEVIAVDFTRVTVMQRFVHRHNGVVVEQGATPMSYHRVNHTFEPVEA